MKKGVPQVFSTMSKPLLLLIIVTLSIFLLLEILHPFFFLQDDNRDQYLPYLVQNYRAVISGEFPLFNFHQHLGTPVTVQYANLYPVYYLAMFFSQLTLGHPQGVMDVVACIHLFIAVTGIYCFLKSFGLDELTCMFAGIAWGFCGFVVVIGNSWIYVTGYAAYLPWILLFSRMQIYGISYSRFILLAMVRLMALFLGNPQFFAYTILFDAFLIIAMYLAAGSVDSYASLDNSKRICVTHFVLTYFLNYLIVALMALPMLLPAYHQVRSSFDRQQEMQWEQYSAFSYKLNYWLNGLLMPLREIYPPLMGEQDFISHIGYLAVICLFIALFVVRGERRCHVFLFLGLAAVSLCWACNILVSKLVYHIPVYNRFRWPFKVSFFTSFFLICASSFGFDLVCRKIREHKKFAPFVLTVIFIVHIANFLLIYTISEQRMISRHLEKVPFDEPLKGLLMDGRIVSVGLDVVRDGDRTLWGYSVPSVGFNYATLWGLNHFGGYDGLLPKKNFDTTLGCNWRSDFNVAPGASLDFSKEVPLDHFRLWGVKWYVVDRNIPLSDTERLKLVHSDNYRNILRDDNARPYVYWSQSLSAKGVSYRFRTNSLEISLDNEADQELTANILHNQFFVATLDGKPAIVRETEGSQVAVDIPSGRHFLVVSYVDTYFYYGAVISGAVILLLICYLPAKRKPAIFRQTSHGEKTA